MHTDRVFSVVAVLATCAACAAEQPSEPTTAFTGATLWDGTGAAPVADATLLVRDGRVVSIEPGGDVPAGAEEVALEGRWVVPGLVDAHAHASGLWSERAGASEVDRIRDDLTLFARYGVTTVNSLGDGDAALTVRADSVGRPDGPHARLRAAGPVITDSDAEGARAAAEANADAGVDWLKLRVDDNLGTSQKMPWDAVQAVVDVSSERGIPVATHLFYLDDAKRLLEMGTDMVAHSVRDAPVDQEFIDRLAASDACYVPTLTREVSTFAYGERPEFFDDPFFQRHALPSEVARVSAPDFMARMAESETAAGYRAGLEHAMANVATLHDAGARIAMGTDAGPAARFPGYFEHLEMWMMADAGMGAEAVLRSATAVAAECARIDDVGTLEPGKHADFLVLTADPLEDIRNTASLEQVFIGGRPVG